MIEITTTQLYNGVSGFYWPMTRILGVFSSAPFLSNNSIPIRIRVALGFAITLLIAPSIPPFAEQDPMSYAGILILIQQFIIGVSIGFVLRIIFTGVELAGEMMSMSMGLGFATFFDPQSKGRSSSISQFLSLLLLQMFLACDLHLLLIDSLVGSFTSLPIGRGTMGAPGFQQLAYWGARIFSIGLQLSMPVVTALLITNMALGVLTRAAPQLNLFGIGFPLTLVVGYSMIYFILPYLTTPMLNMLNESMQMLRQITRVVP
jgi:flagellar biosynthetic protein FliR